MVAYHANPYIGLVVLRWPKVLLDEQRATCGAAN